MDVDNFRGKVVGSLEGHGSAGLGRQLRDKVITLTVDPGGGPLAEVTIQVRCEVVGQIGIEIFTLPLHVAFEAMQGNLNVPVKRWQPDIGVDRIHP